MMRFKDLLPRLPSKGTRRMNKIFPKLPDAAIRLGVVVVLLVTAVSLVLSFLPPSLTNRKLQRDTAIQREVAREVKYAGASACADCHEAEVNLNKDGYHRNVSCETCHGPAKGHIENPADIKPPAPRDRQFCPTCHAYNQSRPRGFPQINPVMHNPMKPCITCHRPHDPKPPTVPGECTACHAGIERTKSVSPHALLECTTCHVTPEQHKVSPRNIRPSKPTAREFCGQCHGKDSKVEGPPKIELATHGEKYLCWQCHYPHMPEVHHE
jgi:cytochrome c553